MGVAYVGDGAGAPFQRPSVPRNHLSSEGV